MGARDAHIVELIGGLTAARTFDDAVEAMVPALADVVQGELAASPCARQARILRYMVHFRPSDGYARLLVDALASDPPELDLRPSSQAWRCIAEHDAPVVIDVNAATVTVGQSSGELAVAAEPLVSLESRGRLLARAATHVLALPLRAPGRHVEGMVSVEVDCRAAIGTPFLPWESVLRLQPLVDVAAPYLCILPQRRTAEVATDSLLPVIGRAMAGVVAVLRTFAEQDETILLAGPTGSGKSRLARWCHSKSSRRDGPFESVDLSTVPEELQMAELFGWKRGAFTGATKDTLGAVVRADHGTLFLDEIDKLSMRAQAGLLRIVEERRYRPLGEGSADRSADVRFVIGTNANLRELIREGRFREDLYYRVNVLPVSIPPLSERRDEIEDWAHYMARRHHRGRRQDDAVAIAEDATALLSRSSWPGNLRQLDNIVRRAYALALLELDATVPLVIRREHVQRAFALDGTNGASALLDVMRVAAAEFLAQADRHRERGQSFDLDHAEALRGLVLAGGLARGGAREEVFALVGKESVVQNRNLSKVLRQELKKVQALYEAVGEPVPPWIAETLGT